MLLDINKSVARRFREETWTADGFAALNDVVAPTCVLHVDDPATPRGCLGPKGLAMIISAFLAGFPDASMTVQEVLAEGNHVAAFWTATATHAGEIWGLPATHKTVTTSGMDFLQVIDGKVVEARTRWDSLGLLAQIGAIPQGAVFLNDGQ